MGLRPTTKNENAVIQTSDDFAILDARGLSPPVCDIGSAWRGAKLLPYISTVFGKVILVEAYWKYSSGIFRSYT